MREPAGSVVCSKCRGQRDRPGQRYCRACHAEHMRLTRPKHRDLPEGARRAANARAYANTYQRRGKLAPAPCERCGSLAVQKHHDDYGRPLQVRWLCRPCHLHLHRAS